MNYFNLKVFLVFVCWQFFAVASWFLLVMMLMARVMAAVWARTLLLNTTCRVSKNKHCVQD